MLTNYEFTKQRSAYHYDAQLMDPRWDCVRGLGKFQGDWQNYVTKAVQMSQIVNWANKRYTSESEESTGKNLEINDLLVQGLNPEHNVMHRVVYDLSPFPKWQKIFFFTVSIFERQWTLPKFSYFLFTFNSLFAEFPR